MGFMVDRVAVGNVCFEVIWFSPVSMFAPMLHSLLYLNRQANEAWEPTNRALLFCILRVDWTEKYFIV